MTIHSCDHPRLLVQGGVCFLCDEFDGQTDVFQVISEASE